MGDKLTENIIGEINYSLVNLQGILAKFKKDIGDSVRLLLNEDIVYTVAVFLSIGIALDKNTIGQKAQELIPEDLNNTIWDFKKVSPAPLSGAPEIIQVVAVNKVLLEGLIQTITKAGLHIEVIEPLLIALARFVKNKETPVIMIYVNDEILLGLVQKGAVLATQCLRSFDINSINQFIAFSKEKFGIVPKEVIFSGNTKGIDINQYQQSLKNIIFQIQDINPLISLAYKEDIKGKDEQVLNLLFPSSSSQVERSEVRPESPNAIRDAGQASMTKNVKKHNFSKTTILAISLILAIVILVALIIFKVYL